MPIRSERRRVLMILCQKIGQTGSGVVLKEVVDRAEAANAEYVVLCGGYHDDDPTSLFLNPPKHLEKVLFNTELPNGIPFPIVGMSTQMPYESRTFDSLTYEELNTYLEVWNDRICELVETFQPDLIHVHHLWLLFAVAALVEPDLPIVVSIHGTDLMRARDSEHLRALVDPWTERARGVLVLTEEQIHLIQTIYPSCSDAYIVFGNGFNESLFFSAREPTSEIFARYGIPALEGRQVILCVAKFDKRKGIEWLIRAYAEIVHKAERDCILIVGGSGPEEEHHHYATLATELGIQEHLVFTGAVAYEDVGILMNMASVFVMPSYHEPFGLVLLEALACGCRVVATDQGGPAEFVPQYLKDKGYASLIPGLSSLSPTAAEARWFADNLALHIVDQLKRPLPRETRLEISACISSLTWENYARRLGELYKQVSHEPDAG